jgi:hypothetical protein
MTEVDWFATVDPQALLDHHANRASQRKLRLAAAACARHVWPFLTDRWSREGIEIAECFADRAVDRHEFAIARDGAEEAVRWAEEHAPGQGLHAALAARAATLEQSVEAVRAASRHAGLAAGEQSGPVLCGLLRDIFGNPFRPIPLEPSWLGRDGGVKLLARTLYDKCRLVELPTLADALSAEGCRERALLEHCRGPGPHVRGCWVVDLLTGRT